MKRLHFKVSMLLQVETIPNEFATRLAYTEAFRNPKLEEIWHHIDSSMDTISRGLDVVSYKCSKNRRGLNEYNIKLNLENVENMPRKGDLMLFLERGLESRDQIIKAGSFCTIIVVIDNTRTYNHTTSMLVWMSRSPYGGSLNDQRSYQVMSMCNLTTFACSWEVMTRGCQDNPEIINLMLTKNKENVDNILLADGKYGQFTGKDFGLNKSQKDAVASCISASECPNKLSVRLIWGPPGTGKTKTASVVLLMLLKNLSTRRTLVCAPTNTALTQLASVLFL
jgi:hypothetical protein